MSLVGHRESMGIYVEHIAMVALDVLAWVAMVIWYCP